MMENKIFSFSVWDERTDDSVDLFYALTDEEEAKLENSEHFYFPPRVRELAKKHCEENDLVWWEPTSYTWNEKLYIEIGI